MSNDEMTRGGAPGTPKEGLKKDKEIGTDGSGSKKQRKSDCRSSLPPPCLLTPPTDATQHRNRFPFHFRWFLKSMVPHMQRMHLTKLWNWRSDMSEAPTKYPTLQRHRRLQQVHELGRP
ncbi:hypothetical protein LWI28_005595 [Acer negundo]|uniref:Uncharacterized protein n=1 Tax=Acer negundo TaxID=4023 RepID=A0AAD5NIV5_ACENE|nr:hypothetical protein LWI28_005595 [Acer negundo]KAK4840010.1 hypothetical protein QYF36_026621 [Acer negundo]